MGIPEWNILLNALIAVGLIGYGLWFRNITTHQLGSKDATIETLQTQLAKMEKERTPHFAAEHSQMRAALEDVSKKKQELEVEITSYQAEMKKLREAAVLPLSNLRLLTYKQRSDALSESRGITNMLSVMEAKIYPLLTNSDIDAFTKSVLFEYYKGVSSTGVKQAQNKVSEAKEIPEQKDDN